VTGTIASLVRNRGIGSIAGEDGKTYSFQRNAVQQAWFHDLREGERVSFEAVQDSHGLHAKAVRLVARPS
jgi:cold shock CspA family protein